MKQPRSVSRSQRTLSHTPSKSRIQARNNSESDFYFCHYKNAMYMGGIKAFQKHGRGIMIHDDGSCAITSYFNDFKNGHNVIYKDNSVMSVFYEKNKMTQCALRIQCYLLLVRYGKQAKPQGKALLIDYNERAIFYVLYKKGVIIQKHEQKDSSILNKIFDLQNLQYLIGKDHGGAIKYDIQKDANIACQKNLIKFQAGFYKKGLLNGLGFILATKNHKKDTDSQGNIFLKVIQRGYFINGHLHGQGQKWFKNGNFYYGDFKQGNFQGKGILKNQEKNNWVYGEFLDGNLTELLDYSHEGDLKKLQKLILSIHERKNNWINNQIKLQSYQQTFPQIQNIINSNPTQKMKKLKDRKQQVLKKIQQNFLTQKPTQQQGQFQQNEYSKLQQTKKSNSKNTYPSNEVRSSNFNYDKKIADSSSTRAYFYSKNQQKTQQKVYSIKKNNNQNGQQNKYEYQNSTYKVKLIEPIPIRDPIQSSREAPRASYNQTQRVRNEAPLRNNEYLRGYQNSRQSQQPFNQKRFIGRAKIFKQLENSQQESLPKFSYNPYK